MMSNDEIDKELSKHGYRGESLKKAKRSILQGLKEAKEGKLIPGDKVFEKLKNRK